MTEDRSAPRLHPDDIAALASALREGPVRTPVPPSTPDIFTGIDARTLEAMIRSAIGEKVALFVTADGIRAMIREELQTTFRGVGLPIDEDHIEETSEAVRSAIKWHKRIDKVVAGMAISVLGAIGYALLNLVGIRLPNTGGH